MSRVEALAVLTAAAVLCSTVPASADAPGFATPAVASIYQPGYEPDLAIDPSPKTGGQIYTSTPFGFSTTQSFLFRSNDNGASFHLTEGNVLGKLTTCIGGGDTELQIEPMTGKLFFSDLQGLTNFSNSTSADSGRTWNTTCTAVNGTGVDRQWIGLDTNSGTTPVGDTATAGRAYEDYDNTNQDTGQDNTLGNQLVMNESVDGVHYGSNCQSAGAPCPTPPAVITTNEGIPGNVVVDNTTGPYRHRIYAIHTSGDNQAVILSWCSGKAGDDTAAKVAADCTDPSQFAPGDTDHVNVNWHDTIVRQSGSYLTGNLFASIALDSAGNVYATWAELPIDSKGNPNGPETVDLAVSTDGGVHFSSAPTVVSPGSLGTNVMPWVTGGSAGRIGIAWYGAQEAEEKGNYGPDTLDNAVWNVYYAVSTDATTAHPTFTVVPVSDHPNKFGNISTQGLGGSPDRSLGDFMQVQTGLDGAAWISYVDDTSADRNPDYCQGCGETPPEAAGPIMVVHQASGPSLVAGKTLPGGDRPFGAVADPTGKGYPDAFLSADGADTGAEKAPALDIAGVKVTQPDATHLAVSMSTADPKLASDLTVDSQTFQGSAGQWIVRWAAPQYDKAGDGNIFYVGMQAGQNGSPQFYTGTTCAIGTTHTKYFTYPTTTTVPGSISGATITWTVPLSAVGKPAVGQGLFSITGFTAVQLFPSNAAGTAGCSDPESGSGDPQIPNVIDAAPPFTYTIGGRAAAPAGSAGSGSAPTPVTASGGTGTVCDALHGLAAVSAKPRGRGLRIAFRRLRPRPVSVDIFQVNRGSRVLGDRLVARFRGLTKGLVWSGKADVRGRSATPGYYFVRITMNTGGGLRDTHRFTFVRTSRGFHARPTFYRHDGCGLITSFKLDRPVFGANRPLGVTYRLRDDARVTVLVVRGRHVVHRFKTVTRHQHRFYRLRLAGRHLPRGDYRVVLRVTEPGARAAARLTVRRV